MIAIDWSHTKELYTYDGKKLRKESRQKLLKRLRGGEEESGIPIQSTISFNSSPLQFEERAADGMGESIISLQSSGKVKPTLKSDEESIGKIQSRTALNSSDNLIVLETGCPLSFIYNLCRIGYNVQLIKGQDVKEYRESKGLEKSDEVDAKCIYELAREKPNLLSKPISPTSKEIQIIGDYRRFYKLQKARVILGNQKDAFYKYFGSGDRTMSMEIALQELEAGEHAYLEKVKKYIPKIPPRLQGIKGLGERIWAGIIVTANPLDFSTLSRYLRFCGYVDKEQLNHKYNRHAKMLYHMLADEVIKQRDTQFRPIYDKCKIDIAAKHEDWRKYRVNNAGVNRLATFLAKEVYYAVREAKDKGELVEQLTLWE